MNDFAYIPAILYALHWAGKVDGPAPPRIRPAGGTFAGAVRVELEADGAGTEIRYTSDGSEPDGSSPLYREPLMLSRSAALKARSFRGQAASRRTAAEAFEISEVPFAREGLRLRLRADAGVESQGGRVARWSDQSGEGRDAAQTHEGSRPEWLDAEAGGRPTVRGGEGRFLEVPTLSLGDATVVLVARFAGPQQPFVADGDDGHVGTGDPGNLSVRFSAAERGIRAPGVEPGRLDVWTVVREGANVRFYRNGRESGSGRSGSQGLGREGPSGFHVKLLFAQRRHRGFSGGALAEVLVFDRALGEEDRRRVEAYALDKYRLR
jgi:hypothetical protein